MPEERKKPSHYLVQNIILRKIALNYTLVFIKKILFSFYR
jgi:hypothetical protein